MTAPNPSSQSRLRIRFAAIGLRIRSLAPGNYWRNVAMLTSGTMIAQAIGIGSMLIIARLYIPADLGAFAFFMAISGFLAIIASGRYDQAVHLSRTSEEAAQLAFLTCALAACFSLLLAISSPVIVALSGRAILGDPWMLPFIALAVFVTSVNGALNSYMVHQRQFKRAAQCRVWLSLAAAISTIAFGLFGWTQTGLILGFVIGQTTGAVLLFIGMSAEAKSHIRGWRMLIERGRFYLGFVRFALFGEVLNYGSHNIIPLLSPALFNLTVLGHFNMGQRVATMPIALVGGAMGEVFRSAINPQNAQPHEVARIFDNTAVKLASLAAMLTLPLLLAGPQLFAIAFGEPWRHAGLYAQILTPLIFTRFITSPLGTILYVSRREKREAAFQGLFVVTAGIALMIGIWMQSFLVLVGALSTLHSTVYVVYFLTCRRAARQMGSQ